MLCVYFLIFLFLLYVYNKWKHSYWSRRGVYTQSPEILFGNTRNVVLRHTPLAGDITRFYQVLTDLRLPYGGFYYLLKPIFVPVNLDLINCIMIKDFQYFTDHPTYTNIKVEPITGNLFSLKGDEWKQMRTKLTPTFTSGKIKMMFNTALDCTINLLKVINERIEHNQPVSIRDVSSRFTNDVIMSCAFGVEGNCLTNTNSDFYKFGQLFMKGSFKRSCYRIIEMTLPGYLEFFNVNTVDKRFSEFIRNLVTSVVDYRETNNIIRKDFMHLMIQLKNNVRITDDIGELKGSGNQGSITLNDMIAQSFLIWFAGYESSSSTISFCLYEISKLTHIQDRVREEIVDVLEKHEQITYESLDEMTYLDQCIRETLRKYPTLPVHLRACTKDYQIPNSDIVLPKGMRVTIPVQAIQYNPEIYPNPLEFDPDRFSRENSAKRHPMAWTPFGAGPRLCIGQRFAMMQTKMCLAVLIKNYNFTLNERSRKPLTFTNRSPILAPNETIWLDVQINH